MVTPDPITGTFFHGVGALSASTCYTPQKKVHGWSWQTYWLAQAFVCWVLLPVIVAIATIPELRQVLAEAPTSAMRNAFLLGMAYGIGGTAFGLSIRYIGFSLTYAIAIGLSSVLGTIVPPLVAGELGAKFSATGGGYVFGGLAIGTIGIALTGLAGRIKEIGLRDAAPALPATPGVEPSSEASAEELTRRSPHGPTLQEPTFNVGMGLLLSLIAGVLSSFYGFAMNAGQPIADIAAKHGADYWQGNVVYLFSNSGAFVTTLLYCTFLHLRDGTLGEFFRTPAQEPASRLPLNYFFAALTGVLWFGQFFFYQLGHVRMGDYKFSSWALHMTMLVLFSGLIALLLKEWRGTRRSAQMLFAASMAVLVIGVFVLSYGNYIGAK